MKKTSIEDDAWRIHKNGTEKSDSFVNTDTRKQ